MKYKEIIQGNGRLFIKRLSFYLKKGSLKIHLIVNDDCDEAHSHPWDFKSFILFGGYKEECEGSINKYRIFSVNRKLHHQKHKTSLFRFFGFKVPAVTIGFYSKKLQLCSFCQELGYCKLNGLKMLENETTTIS